MHGSLQVRVTQSSSSPGRARATRREPAEVTFFGDVHSMNHRRSHSFAHTVSLVSCMAIVVLAASSCGTSQGPAYDWQQVQSNMQGGLLSVWGFSQHDIYVVGTDSLDEKGPTALHYDGSH